MDNTTTDTCPCGYPIADHIEKRPCVFGKVSEATSLQDLPIFGWAWRDDARDLGA
jgi:hypothetical protein